MSDFEVTRWLRPNIRGLEPYSSARDEFSGEALVYLDANENPYENGLNRYPDPRHTELRKRISAWLGLDPKMLFLGNGSDEAIDLLFRASCNAGTDRAMAISPSYGMYAVCAAIQGVEFDKVLLNDDFSLSADRLIRAIRPVHKLIFLCSPNNPTGNLLDREEIIKILEVFSGVVVVDEAYIDFSDSSGLIDLIDQYPNLVILRTFSKAWGLAGVRCGMAIGNPEIISVLMKIKYPYNLNSLTQKRVLDALNKSSGIPEQLDVIRDERERLFEGIESILGIREIFVSEANFILVKVDHPKQVYNQLLNKGLVVRNRSSQDLCAGCLRITVGTPEENQLLIESIKTILS